MKYFFNMKQMLYDNKDNFKENDKCLYIICNYLENILTGNEDFNEVYQAILSFQYYINNLSTKEIETKYNYDHHAFTEALNRFVQLVDAKAPKNYAESFRKLMALLGYHPDYIAINFKETNSITYAAKWWGEHVIAPPEIKEKFIFDVAVFINNSIKACGMCDLNAYSVLNYIHSLKQKYGVSLDFVEGIHAMYITEDSVTYRENPGNEVKTLWQKEDLKIPSDPETFDKLKKTFDINIIKNIK